MAESVFNEGLGLSVLAINLAGDLDEMNMSLAQEKEIDSGIAFT